MSSWTIEELKPNTIPTNNVGSQSAWFSYIRHNQTLGGIILSPTMTKFWESWFYADQNFRFNISSSDFDEAK